MSEMKRFAEDVSVSMGLGGELTDEVLMEAQRRLDHARRGLRRNGKTESATMLLEHQLNADVCEIKRLFGPIMTESMVNDTFEWAAHAWNLALDVRNMANRTDATGGYRVRGGRPAPTTFKDTDGDWLDLLDALYAHFRGERTIGFHSTTPGNLCRWVAFDIDAHGPDDDADESCLNHAKALLVYHRLESRGYTPYIFDSNGRGGFHIWAMLHEPTSSVEAFELAREIADGLDIEAFPKQREIREDGYGNWLRLPGLHHKGDHWSRVWLPAQGRWGTASETIQAVIQLAKGSVCEQPQTIC